MPRPGPAGRWPGFVPALVALLVTLLVTGLTSLAGGREAPGVLSGALLLVLLPAPLVLAGLWGGALLTGFPPRTTLVAAGIWFAVTWVLWSSAAVWALAGHVVGGLLAGLAVARHWRLDAAVLAVALALTPVLVWSALEMPPREQFAALGEEMTRALEENLPAGADDEQRAAALEKQKVELARVTEVGLRIYPFVLAIGVLGQAGIVLAGLWLMMRVLGVVPRPWRLPPFTRWRVPFYVVWVLIGGLGLMVTRREPWSDAGLNLALLGATVLGVQGIAIQVFVTGRMMSLLGRVVYWTVMGIFFVPLVLASGVVLGLVDQWWDVRRLNAVPGDDDAEDDNDDNGETGA